MTKHVSTAQAKAQLSALIAEVAYSRTRVIVERRGRPLAALVSLADLAHLEQAASTMPPRGALALVGAWGAVADDEVDALVETIYSQRERDLARPVVLSD